MQGVMVMLRGGIRRHAQTQRKGTVCRRRALVMVVSTRNRAGTLVMVAAVEPTLFKIRVHYGVNFGGFISSLLNEETLGLFSKKPPDEKIALSARKDESLN